MDDVVLVLLVPVVPEVSVDIVPAVSVDIVPVPDVSVYVSTATVSVVDIVSLEERYGLYIGGELVDVGLFLLASDEDDERQHRQECQNFLDH